MNNQKTLVIHISDPSTTFLKKIYEDKPDWNIVEFEGNESVLNRMIEDHDQIVMMGHGCPNGLFGPGRGGLVINSSHIELLKTKQLVGIWCNTDLFFINYGLKGFYTGMIISELNEAFYMGIRATHEDIKEANIWLGECIKNTINSENMLEAAKLFPANLDNKVIRYNYNHLYKN